VVHYKATNKQVAQQNLRQIPHKNLQQDKKNQQNESKLFSNR
jgi:hypothetical protein